MEKLNSFLICSLSSICSSIVTHPIDVIKVRVQTNKHNLFKKSMYQQIYGGVNASILRNGSFVTSKMFIYDILKAEYNPKTFYERVLCGITSGTIGSLVGTPFDQVMVKMQNNPSKFNTINHTINYILRNNGVTGLWKGLFYTTNRAIIVTTCQFSIYEQLKSDLQIDNEITKFLVSSTTSSFVTSVLSNPIDVCKNRIVCDIKNVSISNVIKNEGILTLWKGWYLNLGRQVPLNFTSFGFFELFYLLLKN